ncbi:cytochrome P450 [Trichophaea hybrida]|nr:cytochrome P450 [Trichophaea hybrida]
MGILLHLESTLEQVRLSYSIPTFRQFLIYAPLLWLIFCALVVIRRIWFHPLSHVPGPKLAAATHLYHAYYQVWRGGEFYQHRPALHAKYGPAIRISPRDVEIWEPELYHTIYKQKTSYRKDPVHYHSQGLTLSVATMLDPSEHRTRRALLNPMLSKRKVLEASDVILQGQIEKFVRILEGMAERNVPIPLSHGFYAITSDIMSVYLFGKSWNLMDEPGFRSELLDSVLSIIDYFNLHVHFKAFAQALAKLGVWFPRLIPVAVRRIRKNCEHLILEYLANPEKLAGNSHTTLMESMLNPPVGFPKQTFPFVDVVEEAVIMIMGGTDSTANSLQFATWRFLTEPGVKEKVLAELDSVERDEHDRFQLHKLEALPYFTGFIKEVLRVYIIVPVRLPRIVPEDGLTIPSTGLHIPAGSCVTQYIGLLHHDPRIFEHPEMFKPERWIGNPGLDKWLLSFSKGDRNCIGMHLAYAEINFVLANLFTRFDLQLWNTTKEDMQWKDCGAARPVGRIHVIAKKRVR